MSFAKEGYIVMAIAVIIAAGAYAGAIARRSFGLWLAAFVLTLLALWVAYFFRDPERTGDRGERLVVSPADGKVIMITEAQEPAFMRGSALRRRFGSPVDVFVPTGSTPRVLVGDRASAGTTVLAELPQ